MNNKMTTNEQVKILCILNGISEAELARRLGKSPQNFNAKMKRQSFTIKDLDKIAEVLGVKFESFFVLENGDKI